MKKLVDIPSENPPQPAEQPPHKIVLNNPTPDIQRAFDAINAFATGQMGDQELIRAKQETVSAITNQKLLDRMLREHPLVYVGSGTDIEYPLCLGGREIIMIDPIFESPEAVAEIEAKIGHITQESLTQRSLRRMEFLFDFGNGKEPVEVHFAPKYYGSPESLERQRKIWQNMPSTTGKRVEQSVPPLPRFEPPEEIGLLLGFQSMVVLSEDPQTLDNIVEGGYVLTNEVFTGRGIEETHKIRPRREAGDVAHYTPVKLASEAGNTTYTFLQKNFS